MNKPDLTKACDLLSDDVAEGARACLDKNRQSINRKSFTLPSGKLYPAQWFWDSAFIALGYSTYDENLAWSELRTVFSTQWDNGMIPHIGFHDPSIEYNMDHRIWQAQSADGTPTSGITQPPVIYTVLNQLIKRASDADLAKNFIKQHNQQMCDNILWFINARDPEKSGMVTLYHPWESGMDNSPIWDNALSHVTLDYLQPYKRGDDHIKGDGTGDSSRPDQDHYNRYMSLLFHHRSLGYNPDKLWQESEFSVQDIGFNAIFYRALSDYLELSDWIKDHSIRDQVEAYQKLMRKRFDQQWYKEDGLHRGYNLKSASDLETTNIGSFLMLLCKDVISDKQKEGIVGSLCNWSQNSGFEITSVDPTSADFELEKMWRGPVWINTNWMIATALKELDEIELSHNIKQQSFALIKEHGFWEYFHPRTGQGLATDDFSWTAALALYWGCCP